jgi:hypothetical protein
MTPVPDPSDAAFPAGPRYTELLDSDPQVAWVRYKIWAADWYTARLGELGTRFGSCDRQVGIEMAIDGALGSLCGAFDASVALLNVAAERSLNVTEADRIPSHRYGWESFKGRVADTRVGRLPGMADLIDNVSAALEGQNDAAPTGWLVVLRRLRNRATHQTSLPRTWTTDDHGGGDTVVGITGIPNLNPFEYLKDTCNRVSDLTEQMLAMANAVDFIGVSTRLRRERW